MIVMDFFQTLAVALVSWDQIKFQIFLSYHLLLRLFLASRWYCQKWKNQKNWNFRPTLIAATNICHSFSHFCRVNIRKCIHWDISRCGRLLLRLATPTRKPLEATFYWSLLACISQSQWAISTKFCRFVYRLLVHPKTQKKLAASFAVRNYEPFKVWPAVGSAMFDPPYLFATKVEKVG